MSDGVRVSTATEPDDESGRPRSVLALLRDSRFGRYFAGTLVSNVGTWCHDIAAAIFVFQVTGLASMVALVAVAAFSTTLISAPAAGALADRFDRRSLLLTTMIVLGAVSAAFAVLVGLGAREVWLVLVVTAILGVGRSLTSTTLQAYLPSLVPPRDLAQASALNAVTFNLARAIGPALGALLITVWGPAVAFGANAVSFFLFAAVLVSLKVAITARPRPSGGVLGGFRYVAGKPRLIVLLVLAALVGMATDPVITLGPSFAEHFGQPQEYAGWFVSAFGAGAVCAAPFVGAKRHRIGPVRTSMFGFAGIGLGFAAAGLIENPFIALGGVVVAGFSYLTASSDITTSLLEQLDDGVRGRVMAIWTVGFQGARPIAALMDGAIADAFAPAVAILVMAGLMIATFVLLLPNIGRMTPPPPL
jgi:MFS family permease